MQHEDHTASRVIDIMSGAAHTLDQGSTRARMGTWTDFHRFSMEETAVFNSTVTGDICIGEQYRAV